MQKIYTTIFYLFCVNVTIYGQANKESISNDLNIFYTAISHHDWRTLVDHMYFGRSTPEREDSLLTSLGNIKSDSSNSTIFRFEKLRKIAKSVHVNKTNFSLIQYSYKTYYDFSKMKNEGGANLVIAYFIADKEKVYGKRNVRFDKEKFICTVRVSDEIIGIKEEDSKNWKFIKKELAKDSEINLPKVALSEFNLK